MEFFTFDDDYVRRLRAGDRLTVEHYVDYFKVFLALKLHGRVPAGDIHDVAQEVHSRVFNALQNSKGPQDGQKFGAWVNGICNHVVMERRRERETENIEEYSVSVLADSLQDVITKENQERVRRTLDALGPRDAEVLKAKFLDELETEVICRRLGVTPGYLRVLVFRALEKFREKHGLSG